MPGLTTDKEWHAEMDANTLAEANVITKDKERHNAAKSAAIRIAEKRREEANAMGAVAGRGGKGGTGTTGNVTKPDTQPVSKPNQQGFNVFKRI